MSSTLQINLNLTEDGRDALKDTSPGSIELKSMYLVNVKYTEEPTALPSTDQCLKDEKPSGSAGFYLGYFNNTSDDNFTGKSLLVTFLKDDTEEIFSWGTFSPDFIIEPNIAKYIQYSYNLADVNDKTIWFDNSTTYAVCAERIGTVNAPTSLGNSLRPIYLDEGEFKTCILNIPSHANDSEMSYDSPSASYLLVTPAQIKMMIDEAINKRFS